jgi:hypothetical protein
MADRVAELLKVTRRFLNCGLLRDGTDDLVLRLAVEKMTAQHRQWLLKG